SRQKIRRVRNECLADRAVEVSLPSRLIVERIEHPERGRAQTQCEPQWSGRFLVCQLKSLLHESGELLFFSDFRFQSYEKSYCQHFNSPKAEMSAVRKVR